MASTKTLPLSPVSVSDHRSQVSLPHNSGSVLDVFAAANVPITFDTLRDFTFEDVAHRPTLKKNKCILMGVMVPEKGQIAKYTDNHKFYKHMDLYANINLCYSFPSVKNRHNDVDIAVIRENTEGEFSGIEHEVYPGVMESLKVTTRVKSERLLQYAFEFAHLSGRKKVSVIHKANIMKLVDGLFLECARKIATQYPFIKYEEMIVDNCSMQLVKNPSQFDVMVAPNLYGTILSHICAGITGGVGMTPGACVGNDYALFSQGMPHSGMTIAGKNIANPTSMLLSSIMMLRYLGLPRFADQISYAVNKVITEDKTKTRDIGGNASTSDFTEAVIRHL
jgi:isocitrate dehydrogenase (NAD+)